MVFVCVVPQVVDLANTAYENTTAPEIKAESCFLKARVHHARGNLSEAKLLYTEACNLWPQFPPAQYGMAQMLVYEGNIDLAVKALDAVLAELPDNQVQKGCGVPTVLIRCNMHPRYYPYVHTESRCRRLSALSLLRALFLLVSGGSCASGCAVR